MNPTRRSFLKTGGAGLLAWGVPVLVRAETGTTGEARNPDTFRFAMAGYSFAEFSLDEALAMMKRIDVHLLALKDFHLPLDSSQSVIDQTVTRMKSAGVAPYAVGPVYMETEAAVDRAFAHARKVGVPLMVGVPNYELLDHVETKVKETGLRLAIHNHGPDLKLYPSVADIWGRIQHRDPRLGICMDIGHTVRLGLDPISTFDQHQSRIFDLHIWDVDKPGKAGWCVEAGRGMIDFPGFFRALRRAGYTGTCSLEYAKDTKDPLPGIAESIGYFKGVLAATAV